MLVALKRIDELIEEINEKVVELNAWRRDVLKGHITAQKKQPAKDWNSYYEYIKDEKRVQRWFEEKEKKL